MPLDCHQQIRMCESVFLQEVDCTLAQSHAALRLEEACRIAATLGEEDNDAMPDAIFVADTDKLEPVSDPEWSELSTPEVAADPAPERSATAATT